jgi:uncharacterized protein YcfL
MRRRWLTLLLLLGSGCFGTSGTETSAVAVTGPQGETSYSTFINAANPRLARRIAVRQVDQMDIGGLTKGAVTLQSRTSDTEALQYRWVWFDSRGFEVNSSSQAWQPLLVYGKQTASVQGLAPNPSAKSFKLHLRYQD